MDISHVTNFSNLFSIITQAKELGIKNVYFRNTEWNKDSERVLWYKIDDAFCWMYAYELVGGVMMKLKGVPGSTTFPIASMIGEFEFIIER